MYSSVEMNVNNANVRKPGKKLIDHKNKVSSFSDNKHVIEQDSIDKQINKQDSNPVEFRDEIDNLRSLSTVNKENINSGQKHKDKEGVNKPPT